MTITITPTQDNLMTAVRGFLTTVLGSSVEVIQAEPNRVPEPSSDRFVVMQQPNFTRLATNVDAAADVRFTASISGTTMTVSDVSFGTILRGARVFGVGLDPTTVIAATGGTGTGGTGTYTISPSQTVGPEVMSSGAKTMEQSVRASMQLDFHGVDGQPGDDSQIVSTMMRDEAGIDIFSAQGLGVVPLYADDPRQRPFVNDQNQVEFRWTLQAELQINQVISVLQQYADAVSVDVVSVEATYPPA